MPQLHTKHKYLTRFVNVHSSGDNDTKRLGKYRSYGHAVYDAKSIEGCLQQLRAFLRPTHGEIMVTKCDSHPTHKSKDMDEFRMDSGIFGQFSPPYCHTGVNEVENTWQWDVPAATALLMGCESSAVAREPHYETAMFDIENSRQEIVGTDGKSRNMLYYNRDFAELAPIYVYGSPVKFLVHPEVRDSSFADAAIPGIYRGRSRDDESLTRCWVQSNGRLITVDAGCMRIDERGVINRMNRDHPSHQSESIQPVPSDPQPNFSRWFNPNLSSTGRLDVWTSSTPLPTSPSVVILGAGEPRKDDIGECLKRALNSPINIIRIDKNEIGGYEHDWTIDQVRSSLCNLNLTWDGNITFYLWFGFQFFLCKFCVCQDFFGKMYLYFRILYIYIHTY